MKKIISLLLVVVITVAFAGCKSEHIEKINYDNVYDELIDRFGEYLRNPDENSDMEGVAGLQEVVQYEGENVSEVVGYTLQDINDDGIPEFLVGRMSEYCMRDFRNELYAMFTYKDETPVLIFEGWSRNVHSLTENNEIFVSGSSGASESVFGIYELPTGEDWLKPKDYYFSTAVDGEGRFFHNQSGEFNIGVSKRLFVNSEEFFELRNDMAKKTVRLELEPFAVLMGDDAVEMESEPANVSIDIAGEQMLSTAEYDYFAVNDIQGAPELAFNTNVTVTNFQVTRLEYDYSNNGQQHIFETPVYEYGSLNPGRPLVLKMIVPEGVPDYGISYVDTDGVKKSFNVLQSGETGEFFLYEIVVEQ